MIFIVAYHAAKHLASVMDRIPKTLINDPQVEILVIDDGSADEGADRGRAWAAKHDAKNVTILRNPVNQGYGGNQKLGYRIGIEGGFDFIILLHGDGQYAPELLPQFIDTWRNTQADVVLGSRMTDLKSAKQGGMPWYKMIGNRVLTRFQNAATGQHLSEYHTGYRAYSTAFLRRVPFEINTNEFHFDTEILLQAFHVGARIEEFGIPTHYGGEICRVNGMRYAKDVVLSTLRFKMHQWGMLCDLRYRVYDPHNYNERAYMAYSSNVIAYEMVKKVAPGRVLDVVCNPGFFAKQCRLDGAYVVGLDATPPIAGSVDEFREFRPEQDTTPGDAFQFDVVLLLRVLERMADPEKFLVELRNRAHMISPTQRLPVVIVSTPNVGFIAMRLNLLAGRFNYAQRGILDIRHKRLFTRKAILRALRDSGYAVECLRPAAVPFRAVVGGPFAAAAESICQLLARMWPSMFAFQFVIACRPKPGVAQLIRMAERHNAISAGLAGVLKKSEGVGA